MSWRAALFAAVAQAACAMANAQHNETQAIPTACPMAPEVAQRHLLGLWRAEFEGMAQGATLLLEKHPEHFGSVRGAINRNGERAEVAGDVEDGEFVLEESVNGVNISATWLGNVVQGSCGREIRGTWQAEGEQRAIRFVLRKQ